MKKMIFTISILTGLIMPLANGSVIESASAASLPSASVGTVILSQANVCSGDPSQVISTTVTGSYDEGSGPSTNTSCDSCSNGNQYCGTNNSSIKRKKTVSTSTVTVTDKTVIASATDSNGNSTPSQTGPSPMNFSQTLTASGSDGKIDVTVSATSSEKVTTDTSTTVTYYSTNGCSASDTIYSGPTDLPDQSSSITKTSSSATNQADYLLDLVGPTAELTNTPSTIDLGGEESIQLKIIDGSAGTPWSVTVTATGPL